MKLDATDFAEFKPLLAEFAAELLARQPTPLAPTGDRIAFSEAEAANMLGLEIHVLREQRRLGRIEPCKAKPGRRILYTRAAIEAFLAGESQPTE